MAANLKVVEETAAAVSFDDFWRVYPRRVARKDAMKAWARIKAAEYPKILGAVVRARCTDQWQRDDGRFIPYPASYLRGERWTDELEVEIEVDQRITSCSRPDLTYHLTGVESYLWILHHMPQVSVS